MKLACAYRSTRVSNSCKLSSPLWGDGWQCTCVTGLQVFFESSTVINSKALTDASVQLVNLMQNPLTHPLVKAHLHPQAARYHRNWQALRKSWEGAICSISVQIGTGASRLRLDSPPCPVRHCICPDLVALIVAEWPQSTHIEHLE